MEIIIYLLAITQISAIYCIYKLYEKYNNLLKTFNNEKKILNRQYSKNNNEVTLLRDNINDNLKNNNLKLTEHINKSNNLFKDLSDKIIDINKINKQLDHSINIIKSSNFDLNINVDYLKQNNIIEIIDLLKKNSVPQILKELTSDINNDLLKYKSYTDEHIKKYVDFNTNINDRVNKLFISTEVLNEKQMTLNELIAKTNEQTNKRLHSKINKNISEIRMFQNSLKLDIDTYLDKTYMLVGFNPNNGLPIFVTRKNEYGEMPVRQELIDYWNANTYVSTIPIM